MQKAIQRIQKGFREHLGYTLLYAFLIYMILAVALWLASPYLSDPYPGPMDREVEFQGIMLTLSVAAFSLGLSGWFVGGAK